MIWLVFVVLNIDFIIFFGALPLLIGHFVHGIYEVVTHGSQFSGIWFHSGLHMIIQAQYSQM